MEWVHLTLNIIIVISFIDHLWTVLYQKLLGKMIVNNLHVSKYYLSK